MKRSREHYVFVVPGERELDLRKAARAVGEKSVEMVRSKELLPLTGYVHGGCSPSYSIIDDSYNASLDSVKAALEILNTRKAQRKIAVLGDMKELGKDEKYLQ